MKTFFKQMTLMAKPLAALFMLLIVSALAFGQGETGQIGGTVTDPNGAVVGGATVSAKRVDTTQQHTAATNDQGAYVIPNLQPGIYDVTVSAQGFQPTTQRAQVTVGGRLTLDLKLSLQQTEAKVDIVAGQGGVEVNTTDQQLSDLITKDQIRELPTLTRNPYDLVGIAGNVSSDVAGRGTGYAINGQRSASTSILLDGGENTDNFTATVGQRVPLDSVQEFRVITGNFSAEYGRASGGVVNVATIAGTNSFHGTGYGFNRISRLASNGFDNNARGIPRQVFTRNQFGYSIGGRIIKDKLFFFNNTEWIRVRSGGASIAFIPTPQLIAASSTVTKNFFGNYAPVSAISGRVFTVSQVIAAYGAANFVGTPNSAVNAFSALPGNLPAFGEVQYSTPQDVGGGTPQNDMQTVIRIDYNMTDKTQIYGRYALQDQTLALGTNASSPWAGFNTGSFNFNQNMLLNLAHSFSTNFVSNTKIGFNRLNGGQPLGDQPPGPTLYMNTGGATRLSGVRIGLPGYLPFSPGNAIPFAGAQNVYQLNEDLSWTTGNHTFKFGGQVVHMRDNKTFGAYLNSVQGLGNTTAEALSNLVTGNLTSFSVAIDPKGQYPTPDPNAKFVTLPAQPPAFSRSNRYWEWAAYINDGWRYTPKLTINLGLRYEYYGVQHNAQDPKLDANFYFGSGATLAERVRNGRFFSVPDSPIGALWRQDKNNFAPRVGFAYDVFGDGKTSVRGGFGVAYERNFGNVTFNAMFNPPNYAVVALAANSVTGGGDVTSLPIFSSNLGPFAGTGPARRLTAVSARHIDQNIVNAYAYFWSGSLEHQFGRNTLAQVEYSGSAGRSLYSIGDVNRTGCSIAFFGGVTTPSASGGNTSRCTGVATSINMRGNLGYSDYRAIIASLESNNFRNMGLTYTLRYTLASARDNLSSTFSDNSFFNLGFINSYDPKLDYGYADFDVRHRFSGSALYEPRWFRNDSNKVTRHLLADWSLNTIVTLQSGYPFSIYDISFANAAAARMTPTGPVNINSSNPPTTGEPNQFVLVNTSNQTTSTPPGVTGNYNFGPYPTNMSKRNAFRGPGFWNVDAGLYKRIRVTENVAVQLRAEMFNIFNHANLYIDYSSATFWTPAADPVFAFRDGRRNVQLAAKVIF